MPSLYRILSFGKLRNTPAMFIGKKSITRLYMWISGIRCAEYFGIGHLAENPNFGEFHDFVRKKYGFSESTIGWCSMLLKAELRSTWPKHKDAEVRAVDRFFRDLDEFVKENRSDS